MGRRGAPSLVQRKIDYRDGVHSWVIDPVESITRGVDFGVTPVIVNGQEFPGGDSSRALIAPALQFEAERGWIGVSVAAVPVQTVTYRMELPAPPPWVRAGVSKERARSTVVMQLDRYSQVQVPIGPSETGTIDFQVRGVPTDLDFAQMVETHEEVHVADLKQTIQEILRPWDERLQRLQREEFRVTAPSRQAAEAALYEQAGGTPSEVGQRFVEALRYKGKAFHRTATGASPTIVSVEKSLLGGTLYVNLRHPVGLAELHRAKLERRREEELRRRALDRAIAIWTYNRSQGVVSINTSGEGNRYILNEML